MSNPHDNQDPHLPEGILGREDENPRIDFSSAAPAHNVVNEPEPLSVPADPNYVAPGAEALQAQYEAQRAASEAPLFPEGDWTPPPSIVAIMEQPVTVPTNVQGMEIPIAVQHEMARLPRDMLDIVIAWIPYCLGQDSVYLGRVVTTAADVLAHAHAYQQSFTIGEQEATPPPQATKPKAARRVIDKDQWNDYIKGCQLRRKAIADAKAEVTRRVQMKAEAELQMRKALGEQLAEWDKWIQEAKDLHTAAKLVPAPARP